MLILPLSTESRSPMSSAAVRGGRAPATVALGSIYGGMRSRRRAACGVILVAVVGWCLLRGDEAVDERARWQEEQWFRRNHTVRIREYNVNGATRPAPLSPC